MVLLGGAHHKVAYPPAPTPVVVKVPLFVIYSITPDRGGAHKLISFIVVFFSRFEGFCIEWKQK